MAIVSEFTFEKDEIGFRARMTNIQFGALAARFHFPTVHAELPALVARAKRKQLAESEKKDIRKWIINGWSTEYHLKLNVDNFHEDALRHSLHWAFPQAYYSAYALTVAYHRASNATVKDSHAAVLRAFGNDVRLNKYPPTTSCFVDGGKKSKSFGNLCAEGCGNHMRFNENSPTDVDGRIAQFLNATRDMDLDEKKADMKFWPLAQFPPHMKVGGKKLRASFSAENWNYVSEKVGVTTILDLLYRKRIKANYRDIDTFLHQDADPAVIYDGLISVVACLNRVHESYIAAHLGVPFLESILASLSPDTVKPQRLRLKRIAKLFA